MFVRVSALLLLAASSSPAAKQGPQVEVPPITQGCAGKEGWSDPAPPAHVFGNTYMVGTCGIVSLLVTTPKGHFLIDGATAEAAPHIAENIRKLGFDPKDVRYLLNTHEHLDHAGGLAELKRLTGAKFATHAAARAAMESGQPHPEDPQLGSIPSFEGVSVDLLIKDGATLRIGEQRMKIMVTPGHSPGGTSWTWKACERRTCRRVVYADSLNAVAPDTYRFKDHPAYVAALERSMNRIESIRDCDLLITPHPAQSDFFDRLVGEVPLIDTERCKLYVIAARARLAGRLAREYAN